MKNLLSLIILSVASFSYSNPNVTVCESILTQLTATLTKYVENNKSTYDLTWKTNDGYENTMRFEQKRGIKLDHSEKLILDISSGFFVRESKKEFWKFNLSRDSRIASLDIKILNRAKTEIIQRVEKDVLFCEEGN